MQAILLIVSTITAGGYMQKNTGIWESIITISSILLGLAFAYLPGFEKLDSGLRLRIAAASAALTAILGLAAKNSAANDRMSRQLGQLGLAVGSLDTRIRQLLDSSLTTADVKEISNLHPLFRDLGMRTMTLYTQSMSVTRNGFKIDSTDWAMRSNIMFWDNLTRYTRDNSEWHPRCCAVHRGDPVLWKSPSALSSLSQQAAFVKEGGILERILIGSCSLEEVTQAIAVRGQGSTPYPAGEDPIHISELAANYADVIRDMISCGIQTFYLPQPSESSDFALLEISKDSYLYLNWTYSSDLKHVESGEFRDKPPEYLILDWNRLRASATPFTKSDLPDIPFSMQS